MKAIITPRLVALDTSLLNHLARDLANNHGGANSAVSILTTLSDRGWIVFLTTHHLQEMIRHADERVVAARINLLCRFPQIAWCSSRLGGHLLGSVVDLLAFEIQALSTNRPVDEENIRSRVVRYGRAQNLDWIQHWRDLRPIVQERMEREREVASIAHVATEPIPDRPLLSFRNATFKDLKDVRREFDIRSSILSGQLSLHGDRRLEDPDRVARRFFEEQYTEQIRLRRHPGSSLAQFLSSIGLSTSDVPADVSAEELERVASFKKRARVACSNTEIDFDTVWPAIRRSELPSEIIQLAIRRGRQTALRASGGDLADSYIASFCPYVDRVVVDKRTCEYLRQGCRRHPWISEYFGSVLSVASYGDLPAALERAGTCDPGNS